MGCICESKNNTPKNPPLNYNHTPGNSINNRSTSKGISSKETMPETFSHNPYFKENELKVLKKTYYNLFALKRDTKKTIGMGGQAKIRKYYSPKFKKDVVEKVINIKSSAIDSLTEKEILDNINLIKEAMLLFTCDYPNVIRIYDFIADPPTIVMEYCEKGSLRSLLDNKKIYLPPIYKIFLIYSICDGLGYIHTNGIINGDLKCDNILLSSEKKYFINQKYYPIPKLADFGLSQISPNKIAAGTPGFIAPEIYKGSGLNFKTDIFALGMVMFEILSGLRPLPSDLETAMKCLEAGMIPCTKEVLRKAWELRIEEFLPGIKNKYYDAFYTVMIKCIDEDPKKRPTILEIFLIVKTLYDILKEVTTNSIYDESEAIKR